MSAETAIADLVAELAPFLLEEFEKLARMIILSPDQAGAIAAAKTAIADAADAATDAGLRKVLK